MASIKFVAVLLGFASIFVLIACEEQAQEWECLGQKVKTEMKDDEKEAYKKCGEELKVSFDEESIKKNPDVMRCVSACVYKKLGLLTSDDKLDMAAFGKNVDSAFPEKARAGIKADIKKCADGITGKLTNDDNCKSHEEYQKCVMNAYIKNCSE